MEAAPGVRYHALVGFMSKRKKQKPLLPRTKRMNQERRLQVAPRWLAEYEGSNIIRSYRKRYGVDWLCAIQELQLLGVKLDPVHIAQLQRTVEEQAKQNRERRLQRQQTVVGEEWAAEQYPYFEGDHDYFDG